MGQSPWLTDDLIEALGRLLEHDVEVHRHVLSKQEVARWMDADDRFAQWVHEHQPGVAESAEPYREAKP